MAGLVLVKPGNDDRDCGTVHLHPFDREPRQGSYLPQDATRSRSIVAGPGRALTSSEPAADSLLEERGVLRVRSGIACTMTPDAGDRQQLGVGQMRDFKRVVGDAKVQVGF